MGEIISGLEHKIEIKERTEEYVDKRLKSCRKNTQEFCDSIKTSNLRSMGIKKEKMFKQTL
jgi:hypothetical protein